MGKLENKIYFENGIVHTLTPTDINVIRKALSSVEVARKRTMRWKSYGHFFLSIWTRNLKEKRWLWIEVSTTSSR